MGSCEWLYAVWSSAFSGSRRRWEPAPLPGPTSLRPRAGSSTASPVRGPSRWSSACPLSRPTVGRNRDHHDRNPWRHLHLSRARGGRCPASPGNRDRGGSCAGPLRKRTHRPHSLAGSGRGGGVTEYARFSFTLIDSTSTLVNDRGTIEPSDLTRFNVIRPSPFVGHLGGEFLTSSFRIDFFEVTPVPEPSAAFLMVLGGFGMTMRRRR